MLTLQGMVVNGFVSVVISTIERRFDLSSKQSGFVASGYDMASVVCLVPVSYIGGRGHKPRWIAAGVVLLGLGSFVFALPHFVADFYRYDEVSRRSIDRWPKFDKWTHRRRRVVCILYSMGQHMQRRGNLGGRVGSCPPNYNIGWAANVFCPPRKFSQHISSRLNKQTK